MQDRYIRVTGTGSLTIKPDQTIIDITIRDTEEKHEDAVRRSAELTNVVKDALGKAGFGKEDVKTTSFSIQPRYESYNDDGVWKKRFIGYEYSHAMKIVFDMDKERLGKIFEVLGSCEASPEFNVSYSLKDQERAKKYLIEKAVLDATEKAKILASASDVKLVQISNIDYSFGVINFSVCSLEKPRGGAFGKSAGFDVDIEPDDIRVEDNVTIVWKIE